MTNESELQQRVQLEAPKYGCILERNNSGGFKNQSGRVVYFGLGNISRKHAQNMRSADLVGITTVMVTPDMVGKTIGVFTAVEVKNPDWNPNKKLDQHETAQANWLAWVRSMGGIAGFVNSLDSFRKLVEK